MNCSRSRKWIPLYVGMDLPNAKSRRLEKHLNGCLSCQEETEQLRATLESIRTIAGKETLDWPEGEWQGLMAQVRSGKPEPRPIPAFLGIPRRNWAYGLGLIIVGGIAALLLKGILWPPAAPLPSEIIAFTPTQPPRPFRTESVATATKPQDFAFAIHRKETPFAQASLTVRPASGKTTQDLVSMTLVSHDTGLRIYWTLNKNFEWEEKSDEKSRLDYSLPDSRIVSYRGRLGSGEQTEDASGDRQTQVH